MVASWPMSFAIVFDVLRNLFHFPFSRSDSMNWPWKS
jgi:hypothetical protein